MFHLDDLTFRDTTHMWVQRKPQLDDLRDEFVIPAPKRYELEFGLRRNNFGCTPLPPVVITKIITSLGGDAYKRAKVKYGDSGHKSIRFPTPQWCPACRWPKPREHVKSIMFNCHVVVLGIQRLLLSPGSSPPTTPSGPAFMASLKIKKCPQLNEMLSLKSQNKCPLAF